MLNRQGMTWAGKGPEARTRTGTAGSGTMSAHWTTNLINTFKW